ncbi:hypothetical protein K438DRAFT_1778509 [Mycena galopus ATCC 62051]|nr:hypothetical protein K438DRAFT_1778509 [Mycena galopus ATCC 62051]
MNLEVRVTPRNAVASTNKLTIDGTESVELNTGAEGYAGSRYAVQRSGDIWRINVRYLNVRLALFSYYREAASVLRCNCGEEDGACGTVHDAEKPEGVSDNVRPTKRSADPHKGDNSVNRCYLTEQACLDVRLCLAIGISSQQSGNKSREARFCVHLDESIRVHRAKRLDKMVQGANTRLHEQKEGRGRRHTSRI